MTLGDEKLDVYRLSKDYVAWVYEAAGILVEQAGFGNSQNDFDPDSDFDLDKKRLQPSVSGDTCQCASTRR